jgi:hypothetical protein
MLVQHCFDAVERDLIRALISATSTNEQSGRSSTTMHECIAKQVFKRPLQNLEPQKTREQVPGGDRFDK